MSTITRGTRVVVTLRDGCTHERPHRPDEDSLRGLVISDSGDGDHCLFVLYKRGAQANHAATLRSDQWTRMMPVSKRC